MSEVTLKPLGDRVLVVAMDSEEKTSGGLYIPDAAQEKPMIGKVVASGNGFKDYEMTVAIGDRVLYGKYSGTEIKHEGVQYLIMKESDILAVVL